MRGIFGRLLILNLLIVTVIIISLSLLLSGVLREHYLQEKQDALYMAGRQVNTLLTQHKRGGISAEELAASVNILGEITNARIIVVDMPTVSRLDREALKDTLRIDDEKLLESLERVLAGETIVKRRQFDEELDTHVVAVAMPTGIDKQVTGAVILFSPLYHVNQTITRVRRIIWQTAACAFLLSFIVIYFVSGKIARPIVQVSMAAEELAGGNRVEDLPVSDNDEIGRLVYSFNEMKNRLQRTEKMRKELIAGVSHELRTPLTAIRGFVQGILDGVIPEKEQKRYLTLALQEVNRLSGMVSDLLEMAKLESGNVILIKNKIDLCFCIKETVTLAAPAADSKGVQLKVSGCKDKMWLLADQGRIRQLLWNLLDNAINYTPAGGDVNITVMETQDLISVAVCDTGIGIPEKDRMFVFEKFYRVDKSRNAALGGTGLGLAIAKNIVELHGGQIKLESETGTGTTVTFLLPKA